MLDVCVWQVPTKRANVIACLYKIDYANTKGFCNPSCTEQACAGIKVKKSVVPKRIADVFVRKR